MFSRLSAHSSTICLNSKPSLVAAAVFFLTLNVVTNEELCDQFGVKPIEISDERVDSPLGWVYINQFIAATGITADDVAPFYSELLTEIDS